MRRASDVVSAFAAFVSVRVRFAGARALAVRRMAGRLASVVRMASALRAVATAMAALLLGAAVTMLTAGDVATRPVAAPSTHAVADNRPTAVPVDVELVLAVDVSYSMDMDELAVQREGYADALSSPEFLQALRNGTHGKVAITYFEWAGAYDQKIIVPWRVVDGPESADSVAAEIRAASLRRASRTSISGAIAFAMPLFESNGYKGQRRVIDISGDGPNNNGMPVTVARDEAVSRGFTINGLPIMVKPITQGMMDIENLDIYYEDCVIGGAGAFVIPIKAREKFKEAIRTKLVLEVAERVPERPVMRVVAPAPRIPCNIGETLWQRRWNRDF